MSCFCKSTVGGAAAPDRLQSWQTQNTFRVHDNSQEVSGYIAVLEVVLGCKGDGFSLFSSYSPVSSTFASGPARVLPNMHLDNHAGLTARDSPTDYGQPISRNAALAVRHVGWHHRCSVPLAVVTDLKMAKRWYHQRRVPFMTHRSWPCDIIRDDHMSAKLMNSVDWRASVLLCVGRWKQICPGL